MNQEPSLLHTPIKDLIIASTKVAHVQLGNSLEHALLVLIKCGYSAIPVLDHQYRLHGQISTNHIMNKSLGLERFEYEKMSEHIVDDVMDTKIPRLKDTDEFMKALEVSINHPFVCIENEEQIFQGILTRKSILALVYRHFRNLPYPLAENQPSTQP
ncbi:MULTISPECIES: cyclic-di-AMP-binding protein CbpB [Brevibacillus]|uniref:CBS domain-containing protein n=1 Tax=Brevibacillus invocatus TaxID=173959 RepID=A0A3M8CCP3_9BACL|nr:MULTISPECIES: cyclic-di-AMP-binding protein CbpB [Brevibacillus]MCM3081403.1 CBS domain-containing protein [Brevibacillus invocatus]MCM3431779.1 CBS domain-containing protein [Brevibacillus invocatus]MDH4618590.1 CBS domain-containing protein [Brevibacillus sp. AY1]RNB73398.1 CBS domain-containing protein [Brevibacillus invocatus]